MTVVRTLLIGFAILSLWGCLHEKTSELNDDELISTARTGFETDFQDFYRKQFGDVHVLPLPKYNSNRSEVTRIPNSSFVVVMLSYGSTAIDNYWEVKIELDEKGEISKVNIDIQGFI
jgi:hypothetical protein